jgi:Arc/MetJ-type ribon-helix-helix transcriptional regulator
MEVTLSSRAEAIVRRMIESGQFSDPNDVVDKALDLMEQQDRAVELEESASAVDEDHA